MKKKLLSIGLLSLLALSTPALASPHGGHHCGPHGGPAHVRPMPPHHHGGHVGISFSSGMFVRPTYYTPFNCGYCPISYPYCNTYYTYPTITTYPCYVPNMHVNIGL